MTRLLRVRWFATCSKLPSTTKSKKRSRFSKKGPVLPDRAAAPAPVLVDDDWAPTQQAARVEAVTHTPAVPPPAMQPVPMAADVAAAIEAAQRERSVEHLQGACLLMPGDGAFTCRSLSLSRG